MRLVRLTDLRQAQPQDITTGGLGLVIPDREDNGETTGVRIAADHYGANAPHCILQKPKLGVLRFWAETAPSGAAKRRCNILRCGECWPLRKSIKPPHVTL
jgi:hypothetical protein